MSEDHAGSDRPSCLKKLTYIAMRSVRFGFDVTSDGAVVVCVGELCIETTVKRARRQVMEALLTGTESCAGLEQVLELLDDFLATTDFRQLRHDHPELAGGTPCRVRVYRTPDGTARWQPVS